MSNKNNKMNKRVDKSIESSGSNSNLSNSNLNTQTSTSNTSPEQPIDVFGKFQSSLISPPFPPKPSSSSSSASVSTPTKKVHLDKPYHSLKVSIYTL